MICIFADLYIKKWRVRGHKITKRTLEFYLALSDLVLCILYNSPLLFASPADGGQTEGEAAAMAEALGDVEGTAVHHIVQDVTLAHHVIRTKTEPQSGSEM